MTYEPIEDREGDELEAREAEERRRQHGPGLADVVPLVPRDATGAIDTDRLEAERAAAGRRAELDVRYIDPALARLRELGYAPPPADVERIRIVTAGDVVGELERQHRRAYHRRQEAAARRRRRRAFLDNLATALIAAACAVALLVLAAELSAR